MNQTKKQIIKSFEFYDKYGFLPDEIKKGLIIITKRLKELKAFSKFKDDYIKEKTVDFEKLRNKLKKDLENETKNKR